MVARKNELGMFGNCGPLSKKQAELLEKFIGLTDQYCDVIAVLDSGGLTEKQFETLKGVSDFLEREIEKTFHEAEKVAEENGELLHWRFIVAKKVGTGHKSNGEIRRPIKCFNPYRRNWTPEMAELEADRLATDRCIAHILDDSTLGPGTACEAGFAALETYLTCRKLLLLVRNYGDDTSSVGNRLRDLVRNHAEEFGIKVYTDLEELADDVIDAMSDWSEKTVSLPTPNEDDVVEIVVKGDSDDIIFLANIGWKYFECLLKGKTFKLIIEDYKGTPKTDYHRAWKLVVAHAKVCAKTFGLNFQFIA